MSVNVRLQKLHPRARVPAYQTEGAAACDLCALLDAPVTLQPGERFLVPTGIAIQICRPETAAILAARSGLASRYGIALANGIGVIDSDYTGEVKVALVNLSQDPYVIEDGQRIAQMFFVDTPRAVFEEVSSLEETTRGSGGFGSTGK